MKVILFGATGMVGQGVLRECLLRGEVSGVLAIGRSATGQQHAKLREVVQKDLRDLTAIEADLAGYDACFFCLGVSSAGMRETDYSRVTYDLTLTVARTLLKINPDMTFIYVSGTGTDSSEKGRSMWARVKGRTENDLLKLGFKSAYMFPPAIFNRWTAFGRKLAFMPSSTRFWLLLIRCSRQSCRSMSPQRGRWEGP